MNGVQKQDGCRLNMGKNQSSGIFDTIKQNLWEKYHENTSVHMAM
jgi:hypothetical protein